MVTMSNMQFSSAAVIGTGLMGPGIALTLACRGLRCTLLSRSEEGAAQGLARVKTQSQVLAAKGLIEPAAAASAAARVTASTDLDRTVAAVDLVVEAGPEDMQWKQDLFARMDAIAGADAVLASTTSGLSITAIARGCKHAERVITTHFWNPPHLMPLVEIVKGEHTSPALVDSMRDFLASCGKTPVVLRKDRPGQLGNRLQMALVREAAYIIAEGIADADAVDTVVRDGLGIRLPAYGILEHMDVVGLDLAISVAEYVAPDLYNEPHAPGYFHNLVRSGQLGAKTGRGFYDWSAKSADEVCARRDAFLIEVLQYRRRGSDGSGQLK